MSDANDTSLDTNPPGLGDVAEAAASSDATPWLKMLADSEKAFHEWQLRADSIDKLYANLEHLASTTRDREMQLFWANISVMAPSIYSRAPVPVVVPRFQARAELPRVASEMLERSAIVTFEREQINGEMKLIRDDLVILSRGVVWLRYETKDKSQRVCIEQADRKDFLHDMARKWKDVDWVAKRSWLTQDAAGKRFKKHSADAYKSLDYAVRKAGKSEADDNSEKAGIWELWCKSQNKVVWVSEGCNTILDQCKPHLDLEGFFPCPQPAFGTLERRTLKPVPDMAFYKDQLEEINEITTRISALSEGLRVRGFYAAGAGDVADAIEKALKSTSNNQFMVPIANLSGLTGQSLKDAIAWLPIEVISATITALIAIRKELINDVYEVTGLSDIMRGQTEASETLGAQQLKSQYGSVRIKDKQNELIRIALDVTRITTEIIAENFSGESLMQMAQMPLPTDAEIEAKAKPIQEGLAKIKTELPPAQEQLQALQQEMQQAQSDPEVQQLAQANPDEAKKIMGAAQQHMQALGAQVQQMTQQVPQMEAQLKQLAETVTIDKVMQLLRSEKLRPFILDIETDSTITPDENAAKQRATELTTAVGGYLKNALPLVEQMPQSAPVVAETLKFIVSQYRAGRQLQGVIDKFADDMEAKAQQPPPPNPAVIKAQQEAQAAQAKQAQDAETAKADNAAKVAQAQKDSAEAQATAAKAQKLALEADSAAKDAELKRSIDQQRELDASNARRAETRQKTAMAAVDIENKKALVALDIAHKQAAHEQAMEKGALDLAGKQIEIANKQLDGETKKQTLAATDAAITKDDAVKSAHDVKPHIERLHLGIEKLHQSHDGVHKNLAQLTSVMLAPNVIQRDATGRVTGSHKLMPEEPKT